MTQELETKIRELEQERQSLTEALNKAESQITKWKFQYNAKNAEYILLHSELKQYKKPMNKWIIIGVVLLAFWAYYYFKKDKEVFYDAQEEL